MATMTIVHLKKAAAQLGDTPTRGLVISRTGLLADAASVSSCMLLRVL